MSSKQRVLENRYIYQFLSDPVISYGWLKERIELFPVNKLDNNLTLMNLAECLSIDRRTQIEHYSGYTTPIKDNMPYPLDSFRELYFFELDHEIKLEIAKNIISELDERDLDKSDFTQLIYIFLP